MAVPGTVTDSHAEIPQQVAELREGEYGSKVAAVEPGGAEFIPLDERHGSPSRLFVTWISPNLEFATVFVGVLSVEVFKLRLGTALLALLIGTGAGALCHAVLSARGPRAGVGQMTLSRIPFGWWGNALPAGLQSVTAGIGWFAVNSVSGAFALNALLGWPKALCLTLVVVVQIAVAFFGHNLVHAFERALFPVLAIAFALAAFEIVGKAHAAGPATGGGTGGFLLTVAAAFGYTAGWNPYASDYTRYLPPSVSPARTGLWAGLGVGVSCLALEALGAASATLSASGAGNPTAAFTGHLPTWIADFTLLAIALGAICANAINIYSGALSFLALGVRLPLRQRRAISALGFGAVGFVLALAGLKDAGSKYESFLLVIAYWIGPWLAVTFTDQVLRRRDRVDGFLFDRRHNPVAGWVAMLAGMAVSIPLFSNQEKLVGSIAKAHPGLGDLTFAVGFVVAAVVYAALFAVQRGARSEALVLPG